MRYHQRPSLGVPFGWISIAVAVGIALVWMLNGLVAGNTSSAVSASHDVNAALSRNQDQFSRLEETLRSVQVSHLPKDVRAAQTLYQSLLDDYIVVISTTTVNDTPAPAHWLEIYHNVVVQLRPLRGQFAALTLSANDQDVAHLAQRVADIGSLLDDLALNGAAEGVPVIQTLPEESRGLSMAMLAVIGFLALTAVAVGRAREGSSLKRRGAQNHDALFAPSAQKIDTLTGLPDRAAFTGFVEDSFRHRDCSEKFGVIIVKVIGLERVNSQFGYSFGDDVIIQVGHELADYIESLDSRNRCARTGSVEFSFVIHDVEDNEELKALGHMLLAIVSVPHETRDFYATLDGCAGVACMDSNLATAKDLVLRADLAAQTAKQKGRNETAAFTHPLELAHIRKRKIEDDLQAAIMNEQIFPVYQPQFDLGSGTMVGMEALARWKHPELGMIPPMEFIDAAERVGGIVSIGRHILKIACEDAITMRGVPSVSVNLSVLQIIQDDVPEYTKHVLASTGLDPARLKLEVTESVIIGDRERVYETLTSLKKLGVSISLDDFGTGYSALSYLTDFDWDEIKIDKSFVSKALRCGKSRHVAETIGSLADKMNARLTVEGIETSVQRDLFVSLGYQVAQGFFYAKPMGYDEMNTSPYILTSRRQPLITLH